MQKLPKRLILAIGVALSICWILFGADLVNVAFEIGIHADETQTVGNPTPNEIALGFFVLVLIVASITCFIVAQNIPKNKK